MAHASPFSRSNENDDVLKLSPTSKASQAATRAEYIAAILEGWPPPTLAQRRAIGSLLGAAA